MAEKKISQEISQLLSRFFIVLNLLSVKNAELSRVEDTFRANWLGMLNRIFPDTCERKNAAHTHPASSGYWKPMQSVLWENQQKKRNTFRIV